MSYHQTTLQAKPNNAPSQTTRQRSIQNNAPNQTHAQNRSLALADTFPGNSKGGQEYRPREAGWAMHPRRHSLAPT